MSRLLMVIAIVFALPLPSFAAPINYPFQLLFLGGQCDDPLRPGCEGDFLPNVDTLFDGILTFDPDTAGETFPQADGLILGLVSGSISVPGLFGFSGLSFLRWENGAQDTFVAERSFDVFVDASDSDGSTFGVALPPLSIAGMTGTLDFAAAGDAGGFFGGPIEFFADPKTVPEPASATLLLLGIGAIAAKSRRNRLRWRR